MKKKMRAISFLGNQGLEVKEIDLPQVLDNQVRVKLKGCGVCASNLSVWEGRTYFNYPYQAGAPGHEGWGTVESCGKDVKHFEQGQPVAVLSYNGYAEYDVAPQEQVAALPPSLSEDPFPAEPLGCAVNVFNRCRTQPGDTVAVIGIGFLGAILTSLLSNAGYQVIAISRRPFALTIAQKCGAAHTIELTENWTAAEEIKKLTQGSGCPLVIEAVGRQQAIDLATEIASERGTLTLAGYHQDGLRQVNMQVWNWKGLDVINAHERQIEIYMRGIKEAIELSANGVIPLQSLLTHYYPLEDLGDAMRDMQERPNGFLKGCVIYE